MADEEDGVTVYYVVPLAEGTTWATLFGPGNSEVPLTEWVATEEDMAQFDPEMQRLLEPYKVER